MTGNALVEHLVERASGLGVDVSPDDVSPEFLPDGVVPGVKVFRAVVGGARMRRSLSGIVRDDGTIDSRPAAALAEVFQRWADSGDVPEAPTMATVVGFVRGAGPRTKVIATEADIAGVANEADRAILTPARRVDADGRLGVEFWWYGPMGLRKVVAAQNARGKVDLDEQQPGGGG